MKMTQRQRSRSQVRSFRPSVEALEGREVPSVVVSQFTDPGSGAAGLRVVTNGADDTVAITDNPADGTTTIVSNGVSQDFSQPFARFDLELLGKKDSVSFDLASDLVDRLARILVDLGKGENHFSFNPSKAAITDHSSVDLNILGHNGNDFVNVSFGEILESTVNVQERGIGGSKLPVKGSADPRSSITFGDVKTGIRNSSVDVNIGLGTGNTNFAFNYGADLGHLAGDGVASDFGPSTFNVNITGSSRPQDVDNLTLLATGEVNTASTLNFNVQFLAGNNTFKGLFDANSFQIDDDGGEFISGAHSGGAAHFNIHGGSGNDTISLKSTNQDHSIELSGLFDINVIAGSGKDKINVDFGGPGGFTDDDPFELRASNRAFRLRVEGGDGPDTIDVNLSNAPTATFGIDVAIHGGSKRNDITFVGVNPGGDPTFGPAGSVLIDGGFAHHNHIRVFGNYPVEVQDFQG